MTTTLVTAAHEATQLTVHRFVETAVWARSHCFRNMSVGCPFCYLLDLSARNTIGSPAIVAPTPTMTELIASAKYTCWPITPKPTINSIRSLRLANPVPEGNRRENRSLTPGGNAGGLGTGNGGVGTGSGVGSPSVGGVASLITAPQPILTPVLSTGYATRLVKVSTTNSS